MKSMVIDGIYYALAFAAVGAGMSWLTSSPLWGAPLYLLAIFCLYFFRDPERVAPAGPVAVSPADGKVVAILAESGLTRISVFLNIFDVHVNRSPIAGTITQVNYRKGQFLVASLEKASSQNEQNVVSVKADDGVTVIFKQIAGLIARRIVFRKKPGDRVGAGERVGLIKFGSRVDVLFGPEWDIAVKAGERVAAGSSVLARRKA
jgi:phosphatidylserine decarboxylase